MLPNLRHVLLAIAVTIVLVALGLGQLARYEVAQTQSASLPPQEIRFAGLAFAARADWTPDFQPRRVSLETLAPFSNVPIIVPPANLRRVNPSERSRTATAALAIAPAAECISMAVVSTRPARQAIPLMTSAAVALPQQLAREASSIAAPRAEPDTDDDDPAVSQRAFAMAPPVAAKTVGAAPPVAASEVESDTASLAPAGRASRTAPIAVAKAEAGDATVVVASFPALAPGEVRLPVPRPVIAAATPSIAKPEPAKRATERTVRPPRAKRKVRRAPRRNTSALQPVALVRSVQNTIISWFNTHIRSGSSRN